MPLTRRQLLAAASLGMLPLAAPLHAQEPWPTRTIRLIVPYAAGGFADTRARKIADALGQALGQAVIVENRAGAGGILGTDAIAKASDGYTFGFGSPAPLVTNPLLMKRMPYDVQTAFKPIILIEQAPLFLTVAPNQSFGTLKDLLDYARTHPGQLTYGSSGVGGAHHLSGELLAFETGTKLTHVPYKGGALAANDVMGGHLAFMFEMGYAALPAIQAGKIRALAVSSRARVKVLPDVPTVDEAGVKGFESLNWLGMIAPASTPDAVVERLNQAVNEALGRQDLRQMIEGTGGIVMGGTPQAYGDFLAAERNKWGRVFKSVQISLD